MVMIPLEQIKQIYDRLTEPRPISLMPLHRQKALADRARELEERRLEAEKRPSLIFGKMREETEAERLASRIEEAENREKQARRERYARVQAESLKEEERERARRERLIELEKTRLRQVKRIEAIPEAEELASLRQGQKMRRAAHYELNNLVKEQRRIHENKSLF